MEILKLMGLWPLSLIDIVKAVFLTAVLFTGPLYERGIVEGGWKDWITGRSVKEILGSWIGWRNYVAGPITEELVFRSALIPLHLLAKTTPSQIVFLTPLYFGIAHIHHFYEFTLTHPHTPLLPALLRSIIQFSYTSIFGFYATFMYLRTGSLVAVIAAHSLCNWCGLPRVWGRLEGPADYSPPKFNSGKEKGSDVRADEQEVKGSELSVFWTVNYYVLLVAGAFAFYCLLWPLTDSSRSLVNFGVNLKKEGKN
jgi:prenyl protein peptidase